MLEAVENLDPATATSDVLSNKSFENVAVSEKQRSYSWLNLPARLVEVGRVSVAVQAYL